MIYEVRTYDLKPHSLPEVEKRFAEGYEHRKKLSQPLPVMRSSGSDALLPARTSGKAGLPST